MRTRLAAAACVVLAMSGIGAAKAPAAVHTAFCIPILMNCSTPTPTPTNTPTQAPPSPGGAPSPGDPHSPSTAGTGTADQSRSATTGPKAPATADENAPIFTLPAAQLGGSSISFSGLQSISVVTVPLANGTRTAALKLVADDIAIDDFVLDVRKATGPSLVSTATRMELRGHVQVYVDSLSATFQDGKSLTLGADTPPPGDELPSTLLRVNLGLVGVIADSIAFTSSHQSLKE